MTAAEKVIGAKLYQTLAHYSLEAIDAAVQRRWEEAMFSAIESVQLNKTPAHYQSDYGEFDAVQFHVMFDPDRLKKAFGNDTYDPSALEQAQRRLAQVMERFAASYFADKPIVNAYTPASSSANEPKGSEVEYTTSRTIARNNESNDPFKLCFDIKTMNASSENVEVAAGNPRYAKDIVIVEGFVDALKGRVREAQEPKARVVG